MCRSVASRWALVIFIILCTLSPDGSRASAVYLGNSMSKQSHSNNGKTERGGAGDNNGANGELPRSSSTICRSFPGLTRKQLQQCRRAPDVVASAISGIRMAVDECGNQMKDRRWNCSNLRTKNGSPYTNVMMTRGFRETAFAYATFSAGVLYQVTRDCSMGQLRTCGCDTRFAGDNVDFRWGGCSHDIEFGTDFVEQFLDCREKGRDMKSKINLHNNRVGRIVEFGRSVLDTANLFSMGRWCVILFREYCSRGVFPPFGCENIVRLSRTDRPNSTMAVAEYAVKKCKCHGMSGSCEVKTCWMQTPHFSEVGDRLLEKFHRANLVVARNNIGGNLGLANVPTTSSSGRRRRKRPPPPPEGHLVYLEESPDFCRADPAVGSFGTRDRYCNRTSGQASDGCDSMCCGRGYNIKLERKTEWCHCKFHWCCQVKCRQCSQTVWVNTCK